MFKAFCIAVAMVACLVATEDAHALELRVLDSAGLVRAVRVVKGAATAKITLEGKRPEGGSCVATNVDGLAAEKREPVSAQGVCLFKELPAGSWQVSIPGKVRWRVEIDE